ncbi:membrane protein [[Actinobacillus] muris]|uniref:Membrane protein n=1 Tax=Muribacter muris TaxID=67855 RepID=A0A0J5P6U0_9PAST|nr:Cof-type HAD-IIB family hydrolase [Muribacter muris]KMK52108.1 membrane protein [[Actinobacillus] muris] [Muribacter muris]
MNIPFKAIISDLDGTLLNAHHRIGNFTIETLNKLAKLGVDIFFATGRNLPDVKHIISKVDVKEAMLVTSNGARGNNLAGELLVNHHIPEELALSIMQNTPFNPQSVCINSYQGDDWFINVDIEQLRKYHQDSGFSYQVIDFKQHHGRQTEKIFYIGKTADDLLPIEQHIRHHYGDQLQITYSTPQCLEMMHKNVCKANTLAELVALRGYTLTDCLAFGDGMNDVEMLSQVGKGCIMGNADPRLKQALPANEIIGDHKHEAVASYLRATFGIH